MRHLQQDTLPEWSKGVNSSSTSASCVGSNPTGVSELLSRRGPRAHGGRAATPASPPAAMTDVMAGPLWRGKARQPPIRTHGALCQLDIDGNHTRAHTHNPFRHTTRWSCLLVCAPPGPTHQCPKSLAGAVPAITRVALMRATPCAETATRPTQAKRTAATAHDMLPRAHACARMLTTCTCTHDQCTDMGLRCRQAAHLAHTPGQDRTGDLQRVGLAHSH